MAFVQDVHYWLGVVLQHLGYLGYGDWWQLGYYWLDLLVQLFCLYHEWIYVILSHASLNQFLFNRPHHTLIEHASINNIVRYIIILPILLKLLFIQYWMAKPILRAYTCWCLCWWLLSQVNHMLKLMPGLRIVWVVILTTSDRYCVVYILYILYNLSILWTQAIATNYIMIKIICTFYIIGIVLLSFNLSLTECFN